MKSIQIRFNYFGVQLCPLQVYLPIQISNKTWAANWSFYWNTTPFEFCGFAVFLLIFTEAYGATIKSCRHYHGVTLLLYESIWLLSMLVYVHSLMHLTPSEKWTFGKYPLVEWSYFLPIGFILCSHWMKNTFVHISLWRCKISTVSRVVNGWDSTNSWWKIANKNLNFAGEYKFILFWISYDFKTFPLIPHLLNLIQKVPVHTQYDLNVDSLWLLERILIMLLLLSFLTLSTYSLRSLFNHDLNFSPVGTFESFGAFLFPLLYTQSIFGLWFDHVHSKCSAWLLFYRLIQLFIYSSIQMFDNESKFYQSE